MGRQAFPIIGGIIGAAVTWWAGGTGYAAGYALGAIAGGVVGSYVDPLIIQGNKVGDNALQTASEGGARAIMFGRCCVTATCVIARGNRTITQTQTGGKGSSDGATSNESVSWTFAIGLGESIEGRSITRVWQDETLVYDLFSDAVNTEDTAAFGKKFRFYDGSETQLPDPDLQVFLGDDTPYFRGTAYVVFPNFDLTNTAERIPNFRFEVAESLASIIESEIESLAWDLPTLTGLPEHVIDSITISGDPATMYDVSLFIKGDYETRYYNVTKVVGGKGRFIEGTPDTYPGHPEFNPFNEYFVEIIYPAPYGDHLVTRINSFAGDSEPIRFGPNGSNAYRFDTKIRGGSIIDFGVNTFDGAQWYSPQSASAKAIVTRIDAADDNRSTLPLSVIVSKIMTLSGMDTADFDVSALTDEVGGLCIQESVTGQQAISSGIAPFFADATEIDFVLTFVKRGAPVVRTLTFDDLTEEPETSSRENAIEYPAKLSFFYQSPTTGYSQGTKATSSRYSSQVLSSGEGSVTAPITFYDSDEPSRIAAKLHKVMWNEAEGSFEWKVGNHNIDLIPTDCVGLDLRGVVTRARIIGTENDVDTLTLTLVKDRQSSYTSNVTGIPLPTPTAPPSATSSYGVLAVLDVPALRDPDDQLCYYLAMCGQNEAWQGGQVQRSVDGGSTWLSVVEIRTPSVMGQLMEPITSWIREYTDTHNTITVKLYDPNAELVSLTDQQFLSEEGAIALYRGGDIIPWEIIQYRDAVDNGDGTWSLNYLQRGRMNTNSSGHIIGELFVVLDPSRMIKIGAEIPWIGTQIQHRGVSYGTSPEDADIVAITYAGRSQIEWSPVSAIAEYDGSTCYVHDIVGRQRFGTEVTPVSSANFQGYRVQCINGSSIVETTILGDSAHIDVSSIGTPSQVRIAEMNKITGAGDPITIGITTVPTGSLTPEAIINGGGSA